jgi:hypothetical protein
VQNDSGKWWMLSKAGTVIEGKDNPQAASILAAPGANVPGDVVAKYDLKDKLSGEAPQLVDSVGHPIVHLEDGRAVSIDMVDKDHPARKEFEARAKAGKPTTPSSSPSTATVGPAAFVAPPVAAPVAPVAK